MLNILWFHLPKCEDMLLFSILYQNKLNIFTFLDCLADNTSKEHNLELREIEIAIFPPF